MSIIDWITVVHELLLRAHTLHSSLPAQVHQVGCERHTDISTSSLCQALLNFRHVSVLADAAGVGGRMYVYMCVYVCVYVYVCVCVRTRVCTHKFAHVHVHVHDSA